jgi:hypothetical protein
LLYLVLLARLAVSVGFFSGFFFLKGCFVLCSLCIAFFVVSLIEGDW